MTNSKIAVGFQCKIIQHHIPNTTTETTIPKSVKLLTTNISSTKLTCIIINVLLHTRTQILLILTYYNLLLQSI